MAKEVFEAAGVLVVLAAATMVVGCGSSECSGTAAASSVSAKLTASYQIGPGKAYADFSAVIDKLVPGDVVEVFPRPEPYPGDLTFTKAGTAAQKITIRGIAVGGVRPVISGGTNTVVFNANHYVMEGFEIVGGSFRNVFHHADDVTITGTSIHDCKGHGILGADEGAGSLTLDRVEVYQCGEGTQKHPVYMATDETQYPGSVFRMQHCYLHDQRGGNAVKSRAERNEIYSNWIEGATYRELELIGPEDQAKGLKREDSDVVGNVIYKTVGTFAARIGGDSPDGDTGGRYRFVNNTFIMQASSSAAIQAFASVESLEMSNNAFFKVGGGGVEIVKDSDATWVSGRLVSGQNNWVASASTGVPSEWTGTIQGADPGLANVTGRDVRPLVTSPLLDKGIGVSAGPAGHAMDRPLSLPLDLPPLHVVDAPVARPAVAAIDIGAFEYGTGPARTNPAPSPSPSPPSETGTGTETRTGSPSQPSGAPSTPITPRAAGLPQTCSE
jgi:hypothetical protein